MAAGGFRPDLQGLRVVAVIAVLAYHIWPNWVPGGYIGVEVFFVISGFLITGLLLREFEPDGGVDVLRFYGRRILRLLPAATVVLVSVAACVSVFPPVAWKGIASALYVENGWLAASAVDYLAREETPSALQHFWPLSVEEQYYIGWPIPLSLLSLLAAFSSDKGASEARLSASAGRDCYRLDLVLDPDDGALAGRGLLLDGNARLGDRTRWLGLAFIVASAMCFTPATGFPGYAALLPTLGAALLILSSRGSVSAVPALQRRPLGSSRPYGWWKSRQRMSDEALGPWR